MEDKVRHELSGRIKGLAYELGFDICGIAGYKVLDQNAGILERWCEAGMNDKMGYLSRNIAKRADPAFLLKDAKSLVVTGISYYSDERQIKPGVPVLSRYAYGKDYHNVIIPKLEKLLESIKEISPLESGRAFSDSAPLFEKPWAKEAGLGWQGKHSILINKEIGSFFFLGVLILNLELEYDKPYEKDGCGDCSLCIKSCPTGAINSDRTIDARKCIANLTIEDRGPLPEAIVPKMGMRIYGCDRCQEVCPWNRHAKPGAQEFMISPELEGMTPDDWLSLSREDFDRIFRDSAVERVGYEKLMQNINILTGLGNRTDTGISE